MSEEPSQSNTSTPTPAALLSSILFVVLHGWALVTLWQHAPGGREILMAAVYAGILLVSAVTMKRLIPPLLPSLIPFAVVLTWRLFFV